MKDDCRAVNDATSFVLGWSVEDKIKALARAFEQADKRHYRRYRANEAASKVRKLEEQLAAVVGVLAVDIFAEIDFRSVQAELARLRGKRMNLREVLSSCRSSTDLRRWRARLRNCSKPSRALNVTSRPTNAQRQS